MDDPVCDYCCILSSGQCSRDLRACYPVQTVERRLHYIIILLIYVVGGICLCPFVAVCMKLFMTVRCCSSHYKMTSGVTCIELFARCCATLIGRPFNKVNRKPNAAMDIFEVEPPDNENNQEKERQGLRKLSDDLMFLGEDSAKM